MKRDTHTPAPARREATRLQRLRELLVTHGAEDEWGSSYITDTLAQDLQAPGTRCPRYAGILEESGEHTVIVADSTEQLARDMGALADADVPLVPVELIDLDSGEQRLACRATTVTFLAPGVGIFAPAKVSASGASR